MANKAISIMWVVAFARLASYFFLLSQEKVTKKKATPYRLFPEINIILGRQAETRYAQTAACRNPPKTISISGAVAGDVRSKTLRFCYRLFMQEFPQLRHSSLHSEWRLQCADCSPLRHAEQRRHKGGFSNRLFEPLGEFPIAAFMLSSAGKPLGRGVGVPFSLVTFFLGSKTKVTSCRATPDMVQ
jgi:hypothetical protein